MCENTPSTATSFLYSLRRTQRTNTLRPRVSRRIEPVVVFAEREPTLNPVGIRPDVVDVIALIRADAGADSVIGHIGIMDTLLEAAN